jgi:phage-related protein
LFSLIPDLFASIVQRGWDNIRRIDWRGIGSSIITFISNGIRGLVSLIPENLRTIGTNALNAIKNINWLSLGSNIVSGIAQGILNGAGAIVDAAKGAAMSAFNAAKNALGIHSPSRLFRDEIGRQIDAGIALGVDDNLDMISKAMDSAATASMDSYNVAVPQTTAQQPSVITMNIYGAEGQDVETLADLIADRLNATISSKEAVFA